MKRIMALLLALCCSAGMLFAQEGASYAVKVSSPNGAPGIALALLAREQPENYTYVAAETIAAEFAAARSDFIIAPINAGAKLYKMGKSTYKLAAVVTWGNLYIASQRKNFKLKDIKKSGITLFGENTINASVALYALSAAGIKPRTVDYLAGAANTQSLLLTDASAVVVTAEPALTAARIKKEGITAYPLNGLYKKASGFDGYTQAGLFVKAETAEKEPQLVAAYLAAAEDAVTKCTTDLESVAKAAVALEILPNEKVAVAAIPGCNLRYMSAGEARPQVETTAKVDLKQFGGELPADDFYYAAK